MAKIDQLSKNGQAIYPVTHESAVLDSNGVSIDRKMNEANDKINGKAEQQYVDEELGKVNSQLEAKANQEDRINVMNPPSPLKAPILDGRNNTDEIKLILDYCIANKRKAYFPAGTYLMNLTIRNSFVDIEGDNPRATIFRAYNSSSPTLKFAGSGVGVNHIAWINIEKVQIRGDYNSTAGVTCLEISRCSKVVMDNVELYRGLENDGLRLYEVYDSTFRFLSIGECGNYENTRAGINILNSDVDCSNRLRFHDLHIENCKTTLILDGTVGSIPNNTIAFSDCHFEGRGYPPATLLKQHGVIVKGGNNSIALCQCDFTYYETGIKFDDTFFGFVDLDNNYFSYALTNSIIIGNITSNLTSAIRLKNNNFLQASDDILINSNVNPLNVIFADNKGRCDNIGSYKVNGIVVNDNNSGLVSNISNNSYTLKSRKMSTVANIDALGGITNPNLSAIIDAGTTKTFTLGQTGNANGRGIFLISFGVYGEAYAIGYSRGDAIFSIATGGMCTMSNTNLATANKINIYVDKNGVLGINNLTTSNVSCVINLIPSYVCV